MNDLASTWSRMMAAGASMGQTGLRALETISAANTVIAARTPIINLAMFSPLTGDHKEMARMVPEKVEAFSRAGSATLSGWWKAQAAWMGHMQHFGAMAVRGRFPTVRDMIDMHERRGSMMIEAMEAAAGMGADALAPVHDTATANARRLGKRSVT